MGHSFFFTYTRTLMIAQRTYCCIIHGHTKHVNWGADLGGDLGGGGLKDSTTCRSKGSPFVLFWDIHFWLTDPKIFLKAPLAPIYTNFKGERAPKKCNFLVKVFQKVSNKTFFVLFFFFNKLPAAQKIGQNRVFVVIWESSENPFGRFKKGWQSFFGVDKIFFKSARGRPLPPPPPRENPRSAPVQASTWNKLHLRYT